MPGRHNVLADIQTILSGRFASAIIAVLGDKYAATDPLLKVSSNPKFGDYQANVAMGLGRQLKTKPRVLAEQIVENLDLEDICEDPQVAGPGFINLIFRSDFLIHQLQSLAGDKHLGVVRAESPQSVVIDYSGPNVAKEMHVGHIRSTIIGDCITRVLDALGHRVIRQNHLGDWGTQFGMIIEYLVDQGLEPHTPLPLDIPDLDEFYRLAKLQFDADEGFANRARRRVISLQQGDTDTAWFYAQLVSESQKHFRQVYQRINVGLTDNDVRGESAYNETLPQVISALDAGGHLEQSQGARVVFPDGFKDRNGDPLPLIVQKSDGGYLYATTDLAAVRFRVQELEADRIIYVTDARQAQHFAMVFAVARQAGWLPDTVRVEHVPFGTILGKDKKPFKTRQGGTVKLVGLLDEAEKRAAAIIEQKNPGLSPDIQKQIAHTVGIGALKYADLSSDRIKDYVFDWDRMLALEGNTAPYLQNAYVRIRSIFRKGNVDSDQCQGRTISVAEPAERSVTIKLLQFPGVVAAVADSLEPHRLCTYLYELASSFHQFYENCPVLTAPDQATRDSRLYLCDMVAHTLKRGLHLLGIGVIEQM